MKDKNLPNWRIFALEMGEKLAEKGVIRFEKTGRRKRE